MKNLLLVVLFLMASTVSQANSEFEKLELFVRNTENLVSMSLTNIR